MPFYTTCPQTDIPFYTTAEVTDGTEGVEGTRVDRQTFLGKKYLDE